MKKKPLKINAVLCYLKKNGKTLMLLRNKKEKDMHKGKYNGLGGKMEYGESPHECVIREVLEESGFKIKKPKLKGILTFPKFDKKNDWVVFVFTADKFSGKQIESPEGELKWICDNKLLKLNLWEGDKIFLKSLNKDKFFSGKFTYEHGKLVSYTMWL